MSTYFRTGHFEKDNNPEDFKAYLNSAFGEKALNKELLDNNSSFYFVYNDAILVGYIKINENGSQSDIKDNDSMEIERIYVLGEFQGQGVGAWLLTQVISMARTKNKNYVWLGVWELNTKAIKFYKRSGFYKYGTHPYYIGKDKQTDWLMRLDL
ncbi:GNAT family N-acetyltransferase [Arenibacter sp. BSSL-BM3]|uniref:GNAT family N-acetyltransferase n=1 Tax=Arenibacter arenosicollis TaxID=2762274 RepID=A0ABR7QJZ6_9FLAO|nr:GNAT family N-acetyltransferase [Arenibacter arenosicollis]